MSDIHESGRDDTLAELRQRIAALNAGSEKARPRLHEPPTPECGGSGGRAPVSPVTLAPETDEDFRELSRRLQDIRASATRRVPAAAPAEDASAPGGRQAADDLGGLRAEIARLAERLEREDPLARVQQPIAEMEQRLAELSGRVEQLEERNNEIPIIERALGELSQAIERCRQEAIETAREAAAQAISEIGAGDGGETPCSPETLAALKKGMASVEQSAAATDRRTQETLEAVHDALESIVARLSALEAGGARERTETPCEAAREEREEAPPAKPRRAEALSDIGELKLPPLEDDEAGERGANGTPAAPVPEPAATPGRPASRNHDFIAAARRAAQASSQAPEAGAGERKGAKKRGLLRRFRSAREREAEAPPRNRRRPLLLAAIVLLMISALATYTVLSGKRQAAAPEPDKAAGESETPAAAPAVGAPAAEGSDDARPSPDSRPSPDANNTAPAMDKRGEAAPPDDGRSGAAVRTSKAKSAPMLPAPTAIAGRSGTGDGRASPAEAPAGTAEELAAPELSPARGKADAAAPAAGGIPAWNAGAIGSLVTKSLSPVAAAPEESREQPLSAPLPPASVGSLALRRAAASGNPAAQFQVATRYLKGDGRSVDYSKAAYWYQKAAAKGLAPAQYRLGTLYEKGRGVPRDMAAARIWYERAAEKGNRKAMHNLAVIHANGSAGKRNFDKAAAWFRRAAEFGLTDSQYNLGILHRRGLGVKRSDANAYTWLAIAAASGDKGAEAVRDKLEKSLAREALAKAKLAAEAWEPRALVRRANVVDTPEGGWGAAAAEGPASTSETVAEVQRRLNTLGHGAGPADGILGQRTREAIRAFQSEIGAEATGEMSPELLARLRAVSS